MKRSQQGFTLLELLIALAIVGLLTKVAVMNIGAFVPKAVLESETRQFIGTLDFVRSEARIHGKSYRIELDLAQHKWRVVLPPQDRIDPLLANEGDRPQEMPMAWTPIDDRVEYVGFALPRGELTTRGTAHIVFDDHGFTCDFALFYRLKIDHDYVATVRMRGVMGTADIDVSVEGKFVPLPKVDEASF